MNAAQASGQLIEVSHLDRGILLSDDLPGVTVGGVLAQSSTALTTDLIARVADEPLVFGNAQADNTGPTSIGAYRVLGNLGINSPLGVGDLLSATYLHSEGSNYGRLSYTVPVGSDGLRVGVNGSTMAYRLISSQFVALGATGTSSTGGVEANYPIIRSRSANLYVGANADYRQFSNSDAQQGLINQYSVMDYSIGLFGNSFDAIGGSGSNNGSLVITSGNANLAGSPNQAYVAEANNAQGSFTKIRYSANRNQLIINGLSLYGSVSGQATNANLDSSEMFYLGGAYGVRAYPTNEGAGSQGQLATVELRQALPQNVNATIFYDYGHVQVYPNNNYAGASTINSYAMKGAGLSLGWKPASNIDLKTIWAKRIGANPNPTYTGTYQDGTNGSSQFWFIASIAF
jgi:hemolysin activation/secretion protein